MRHGTSSRACERAWSVLHLMATSGVMSKLLPDRHLHQVPLAPCKRFHTRHHHARTRDMHTHSSLLGLYVHIYTCMYVCMYVCMYSFNIRTEALLGILSILSTGACVLTGRCVWGHTLRCVRGPAHSPAACVRDVRQVLLCIVFGACKVEMQVYVYYIYMYMYICICMYVYIYIYIWMCVCVCVCVCVYTILHYTILIPIVYYTILYCTIQ